jgi:hypothetical protein
LTVALAGLVQWGKKKGQGCEVAAGVAVPGVAVLNVAVLGVIQFSTHG